MRSSVRQFVTAAIVIAGCLLVTTTAAAFALRRSGFENLHADTGSLLKADYSKDPHGMVIPPLQPGVIRAAASDERALAAPPHGGGGVHAAC